MSSTLSTSVLACTRLGQKLKAALRDEKPLPVEQCARWLDLLRINIASVAVIDTELLKHAYGLVATFGKVDARDFDWIERYGSARPFESFRAAKVLHEICAHRENDPLWRRTLWQYDSVRTHVLRTNMQKQDSLRSLAFDTLSNSEIDKTRDDYLEAFGPWRLATLWRKDIVDKKLDTQGTALEQTWWVYLQNAHKQPIPDNTKKLEIDSLLNEYPDSLGGALCFYAARTIEYAPCMESIFKQPMPQQYSGVVFAGLVFMYSNFQALQAPGNTVTPLDHPWNHADKSWPEECKMLEVFLSLYPSIEAARPHLGLLAQSYEDRHKKFEITLPNRGFE